MIAALPRPVQRQAQARSLLALSLNPLGASITFGQFMFLLALHYGASDTAMALLYASLNLTGLLALLAPWLLAGLDTSVIQARAWFARAIFSLSLLGLPLLASDEIKVWTLVGLVYLMMVARTVGVLANASVHKAICPQRELAVFSAKVQSRWNLGVLVTTVLCFAVMQVHDFFPSREWAYMALMAFGVVFNFAAAAAMLGMPQTGTVTAASPLATLAAGVEAWRRPERREVLWLTMLQMPIGLAAAFQLNYLNHELGMAPSMIFLLTLGGVLASILSSRILAVVAGRISTRALWFGLHAVLALVALCWCAIEVVPVGSRLATCAALWVVAAGSIAASTAVYASMLSERLPRDDATRVSAVYQLAGVLATVLGLIALASTRWLVEVLGVPVHAYFHAFALWAALSLGVCLLSLRLARGSAAVDLLAQLTPGNLSTIFRAHQLRTAESDIGPAQALEREELLAAGTPAGRDLVLETLKSPDSWHRHAALRAARAAPFAEAVPAVMAEVADPESDLRVEAVTTLGFLHGREAVPLIRSLLDDPDRWLAAVAVKSLARLGAPLPPSEVLERYATGSPREQHELLIALTMDGRGDELEVLLTEAMRSGSSRKRVDALALYAAQARGGRDIMRAILAAEDERPGAGVEEASALAGVVRLEGDHVDDSRYLAIRLTMRALATAARG